MLHLIASGYVVARLFNGRAVIILGWRSVHVKAPKSSAPDGPKDWIGPALHLEFDDGSRHHGYAPEAVTELIQSYHGIEQAREALELLTTEINDSFFANAVLTQPGENLIDKLREARRRPV